MIQFPANKLCWHMQAKPCRTKANDYPQYEVDVFILIRALIFDFDGLILDTETPEYQSWQDIYQTHGCDLPLAVWVETIGKGTAEVDFNPYDYLEARLQRPVDREAVKTAYRARLEELLAIQLVLPGIKSYLEAAKTLGLKVGLASSSGHKWVDGHLTRLGIIQYFDCIRCSDDVTHTKPDPELYLAVVKVFGIQPQEAIALEDSANGVLAAKRAGLFCVAVPNPMTQSLNFDHADLRLESLENYPLADLIQGR